MLSAFFWMRPFDCPFVILLGVAFAAAARRPGLERRTVLDLDCAWRRQRFIVTPSARMLAGGSASASPGNYAGE